MNSIFSKKMKFEHGQAVSPLELNAWPGKHNGTFYWLIRKSFTLDILPEKAIISIAADRHYEIYINSKRIISQRNYFNADKYIFSQKHAIKDAFVRDENLIEILIRTDAFKNKNYIYFHPFAWLVLEMIYPGNKKYIATDSTWELAIIENWRTLRTLAITTAHEITKLPSLPESGIMGIPGNLKFSSPVILPPSALPEIYEWTDIPKRKDTHIPKSAISSGTWKAEAESLAFNISEIFTEIDQRAVLKASFDCEEKKTISIAASGFCACKAIFNGACVTERNALPGRDLMRQYNYLSPLCKINAEKGMNILEFHFAPDQREFMKFNAMYSDNPEVAGLWFRTIIHNFPSNSIQWHNGEGKKLVPHIFKGEVQDMIGSKAVNAPLKNLKVSSPPSGFTLTGIDNQYVLFDFGKLKKGKLSFRIDAESPGRIYLAYGFMTEHGAVDCARNGKKAVDIIEVAPGKSFYEAFEDRTFVYLDMLFENFSGKINVSDIRLEENIFLNEKDSFFKSSDELMNGIFSASLRTAQLCCDEIYMDNPEREHAQWLDNTPPNMAAGYYAFGGEMSKVGKVISEYAFNQKEDGQLPGYVPGAWGERIPLQCHMALYFRTVWRHFWYSGDYGMLKNVLPSMSGIISFWNKYRNADGLLENIETIFGDWGIHIYSYAPVTREKSPVGIITAMNAYYLGALKMSGELNRLAGNEKIASEYLQMAETTTVSMKKYLFDDEKGLFRDGAKNKLAERNYSQAANALCALYGVLPEKDGRAVLKKAFTECRPWLDIIPVSPHFCMQTGEALFETGLHKTAYSWIRKGFGPMLNAPAGTLWETWEPYVSHCQGTGSAIVYLLSRYHCGIYPAEPGYAQIGIRPYDCGQKTMRARLNTQFGTIDIDWEKCDSGFDYKLSLPSILQDREIIKATDVKLSVQYK
ncbi:MAG: hypothetical protein A2017_19180 [Lentisphaerae bacterium GWF2_44_16]|nr:MAG: hypothetical protein A2017_19180 [Lentisphaerae bacterium GWF2_44_16]